MTELPESWHRSNRPLVIRCGATPRRFAPLARTGGRATRAVTCAETTGTKSPNPGSATGLWSAFTMGAAYRRRVTLIVLLT